MSTTHLLINKLPFMRTVKSVLQELYPGKDFRWQGAALSCLQEAAEAFLVSILTDANSCAIHAKRVTCMPRDIHLILRFRNIGGSI